jgi:gliding motility-associated-like protein
MKINGTPCEGSDLSFSLESASIIDSIKWYFGDSTQGSANFSSLKEPVFRFSGIDSFTIQAIAFLSCGNDTIRKNIQIIDCDTACAGSIEVMITDSCSGLARFQIKSKQNIQLLKWEFGDPASGILNSSSEIMPQHQFSSSGFYKIKSVVLFDCGFDTLETEIGAQICTSPPCEVQIPNAFTPNDDEFNDLFSAQSNCNFEEFELRIFNRWGQEIFFSRNPAVGWNGSTDSGNKASSDGIYFFSLRYRLEDGQSKLDKGFVKAIRK